MSRIGIKHKENRVKPARRLCNSVGNEVVLVSEDQKR